MEEGRHIPSSGVLLQYIVIHLFNKNYPKSGVKQDIFPLYNFYLITQVISRIIINQGLSQDLFPLYNFNLLILKLFQELS